MRLPSLWQSRNEPVRMLSRLQGDLDRFFEDLDIAQPQWATSGFSPSCELNEDKSNYIMKFDLPGVKKDDIKVDVDGNVLTVSAERHEEKKSAEGKSRYSEISYGSYQRSFTLPSSIDEKKVDAKYESGVLTLTMPKTEVSKAKQIAIH